jgi:hypothetical protein
MRYQTRIFLNNSSNSKPFLNIIDGMFICNQGADFLALSPPLAGAAGRVTPSVASGKYCPGPDTAKPSLARCSGQGIYRTGSLESPPECLF